MISQINVTICDDATIKKLNKKYLKRDFATDVLSFQYDDVLLGEVVVNRDQAARQAKEYGNTMEEEIAELVKHGVLHLYGVHHPGDDEASKIT